MTPSSGGIYFTERTARTVYVAASLSLVAALIHLAVTPEHFEEWWGYGTFFLVLAVAQASYGAALLSRRSRRRSFFLFGIAGNLAIVVLWIVTRTAGVPFFGPEAGEVEGVGPLDLSTAVLEAVLVAALVTLRRDRGFSREGWSMVLLGVGAAITLLGLLVAPGTH